MTSALLLAVLLAAPCEHPSLGALAPQARAAACQLLAQEAPGPSPATSEALTSVYARPGFERARQRHSGAVQAWLAQLRAWLGSLFESSGAQTYSEVTRVSVLALALALGLGVALRRWRRRPVREPLPGAPLTLPLALDAPEAHHARARARLADAPREAIREGLLALLATLERQRLARPDRVKTNRELARELADRGAPAELVAAVTPLFDWFDRAWYSLAEVDVDEARRFLDGVKAVTG